MSSASNIFYLSSVQTWYSESNWKYLSSIGVHRDNEPIDITIAGVGVDKITYKVNVVLLSPTDFCISLMSGKELNCRSCTLVPVIKLRNTVEIASGEGKYASPYIMKAN